jgi:ABC-type Mn2+/Zn2+ transport system ATPase subunit
VTTIQDFVLPGLRDRCHVATTAQFAEIATRLDLTARHAATMVVAGPNGTGKKVALMHAVLDQPLPFAYVRLRPSPATRTSSVPCTGR